MDTGHGAGLLAPWKSVSLVLFVVLLRAWHYLPLLISSINMFGLNWSSTFYEK
jgi:hypothetical protein